MFFYLHIIYLDCINLKRVKERFLFFFWFFYEKGRKIEEHLLTEQIYQGGEGITFSSPCTFTNFKECIILFQGDGAFAISDIPPNTIIAQNAGFRFLNGKTMPLKYQQKGDPYTQNGCFCKGVFFDIPKVYEDIKTYGSQN